MEWHVGTFGKGGTAIYEGTRRVLLIKSKDDADLIVRAVNAILGCNGELRIVPSEPNEEMVQAGTNGLYQFDPETVQVKRVYAAMLAALGQGRRQ